MEGEMDIEAIESVEIPFEKKYVKLLHNRGLTKFDLDSMSIRSLQNFRSDLQVLVDLKETDKRLHTSISIIDYELYRYGFYQSKKYNFYDTIRKRPFVAAVQRARILLNIAYYHDRGGNMTGSTKEKKYWFKKVRKYVKPARLDVDKTFEIASYYSFFWQHKYAYALTKKEIDETENSLDLIFFLKLVHLTNVKLSRSSYLRYIKKIKEYSGDEFCTFFNNLALNFQIFDDEEIKAIYCEECADR